MPTYNVQAPYAPPSECAPSPMPMSQMTYPAGCPQPPAIQPSGEIDGYWPLWSVIVLASTAASAYHGYKRNHSVLWAAIWGVMGSIAPVITPAVAVAQGFGKPEKK